MKKENMSAIVTRTALMLGMMSLISCAEALPPDSEYVQIVDGHLSVNGERQRYWAAIGKLYPLADIKEDDSRKEHKEKVELARRGTLQIIDHLEYRGFNAVRFWDAFPTDHEYEQGDGSNADMANFFLAEIKKRGWKVWMAGLNRVTHVTPEDVDIIQDRETAADWKAAVASAKGGKMKIRNNVARVWDPRIEAIGLKQMESIAKHVNPYTGLAWADDPLFGVWELSNEEWWMRHMVKGDWQKLPDFFRNQLIGLWNDFLLEKYGSDDQLTAAWKSLLPNESLTTKSVLLAPMAGATKTGLSLNDASKTAAKALESLEQEYSRDDFDRQRGADVLEFFVKIQLEHKQRQAEILKTWGKSTRLSPTIYDTGIGYEAQSQYLHQNADAVAHDAYLNGKGRPSKKIDPEGLTELQVMQKQFEADRRASNHGEWNNYLLKPPGICQGVPWLEHNRVEGKPYLCYETQIQQPAKYRADFPIRLGTLAAIQDWDWVCWHYFGPVPDAGRSDKPFEQPLDVTTGGHPQGYHYTYDEVQNAMMRAMGILWRNGSILPAPNPTKFIFGSKTLYDPASMDYGGSYGRLGMNMLPTTYQYGVRIEIDPSREDDEVVGPMVDFDDFHTHNPYTPTEQIEFDHKKGGVHIDSPAGAVFAGMMANYGESIEFKNGTVLTDVSIHNPEGIFEPVGDDKYLAFAAYSMDGKPLAESGRAGVSLVSTSFNTGFRFKQEGEKRGPKGTLPVLVARVAGTLNADWLKGMNYRMLDWHGAELKSGTLSDGTLTIPADLPIYVIELTR
jgi:hypothetical protein